ncbi:M48 family metalloprotease [Hymenobacter sp. BT664]|uniref:M48 family metalloprotease n=1 Tax=Hymenobacter montanus TaxID=2771359 RepID=A0A927BI73_9BACT|nr:M56 family metallopeptidase [Hymenobacter montanus]MBD2770508.1 M48 family metalloprotease [Hymenobacter montanus]
MSTLENFVSPVLTRALGWTLLHSLWQGALVAAALAGALLLLRRQRAEVRYVASAGALGLVVALAGITFGLYVNAGASKEAVLPPGYFDSVKTAEPVRKDALPVLTASAGSLGSTAPSPGAGPEVTAQLTSSTEAAQTVALSLPPDQSGASEWLTKGLRYFDHHLPLLVVAWMLGLLAMGLRMLGGLLYVQRLRHHRVRPLGAVWQERLAVLAAQSGVRQSVALLESALVRVPLVVGHVRPVILLPLGAVAGLSPACLEAILAHELAHVLRRDYLVNLLQTVAEVLFFYHPAVWFVASCVRTERENCCDDTATALCGGDPMRLARALTALAEWSQSAVLPAAPRLALAAIGRRGALLNRVRRLVQRRPAPPTLAEGLMAGTLVLGGLGLLGCSVALAGPLTTPATTARPSVVDWQAGPDRSGSKPLGGGDTTRQVAGFNAAPTAPSHEQPSGDSSFRNSSPKEALITEHDTVLGRRASRRQRERPSHRVLINGRYLTSSAFGGNPGTVVITKDKKGRVSDLVVNGQPVDIGAGKRKVKIKSKEGRDDDGSIEIIRMVPPGTVEGPSYVFRTDGEAGQWFDRRFPRSFQFRMLPADPRLDRRFYRDFSPRLNRSFRLLTPDALSSDPDPVRGQREALRAAERALREASAVKGLSPEQQRRINKRLEEVRAQLKAMEHAPASSQSRRFDEGDAQGRDEEMHSRREEMQALQDEMQSRQEELRERLRESRREMQELRTVRAEGIRQGEETLVAELLKDGLIKDRDNFQLKLTASSLVVDGKEQPKKVHEKYLKLYESNAGRKMGANSSVMINRNGSGAESDDMPRPPRPPRAPRAPGAFAPLPPPAPLAPPAPTAPLAPLAPPAPPAPPKADTETVRNELRKDGLIGPAEKSFRLQLNDSGLKVNGKKQPDELAAKYRKLLGHDGPGQVYNMSISVQD